MRRTAEYPIDRSLPYVRGARCVLVGGALSAAIAFAAVPAPATSQEDPADPTPVAGSGPPTSSGVDLDRSGQGVPHVTAPNYEKLGYGVAWAMAEDDLCGMAFDRVRARGELARTFGPDIVDEFTPDERLFDDNVASDFYYRLLQHRGYPERGLRGPQAPSGRARDSVRGYVRGYNEFLERHSDSDPRCAGEAWVKPMTERDVWLNAHQYDDWEFDFSQRLDAEPPGQGDTRVTAGADKATAPPDGPGVESVNGPVPDHSQAIALGDRVTGKGGILAYDPHNPTNSTIAGGFARLTIPGKLDVFGHRSRFSPALYAGANANFSWGLTFSQQQRRVIRRLKLAPGSPTSYIVDGKTIPMGRDRVSVMVKQEDGALSRRTHTFYKTRWGDVLVRGDGSDTTDLPCTQNTAYATDESRIARTSQRLYDYHLDINRAKSFADLRRLVGRRGGFLDSQLTGVDTSGRAYFFGGVGAPNIDAQRQKRCINDTRAQAIFETTGEPVLDGSTTDCVLPSQPDAFRPGTIGVDGIPQLQDRRYVANGNNSHWLVSNSRRLKGFNPFFTNPSTRERAPISPRARLIYSIADDLVRQTQTSGEPVDAADVAKVFLTPRDGRSRLELAGVITWCRDQQSVRASNGASIDVSEACEALARWDRQHRPDSRGGTLWRLFWGKLEANGYTDTTLEYRTPYSADDPIHTPRGLQLTPGVASTFADTVQAIRKAGLPLDATVGDTLKLVRRGTHGPEFPGRGCGSTEMLGCNITNYGSMDKVFYRHDGSGTHAAFIAQLRPNGPATVKYYTPLEVRNPTSPWFWSNIKDYYSTMHTSTIRLQQPHTN